MRFSLQLPMASPGEEWAEEDEGGEEDEGAQEVRLLDSLNPVSLVPPVCIQKHVNSTITRNKIPACCREEDSFLIRTQRHVCCATGTFHQRCRISQAATAPEDRGEEGCHARCFSCMSNDNPTEDFSGMTCDTALILQIWQIRITIIS